MAFGAWGSRPWAAKCASCANYSGSQVDCGYCRVWSAVIPQDSRLARGCPHWTSREAMRLQPAGPTAG
jgi:hypothetical protein